MTLLVLGKINTSTAIRVLLLLCYPILKFFFKKTLKTYRLLLTISKISLRKCKTVNLVSQFGHY